MAMQSDQLRKLQLLQPGELRPCKQYGYRMLAASTVPAAMIAKPAMTSEIMIVPRMMPSYRSKI